jgi:hypothetical protein
MFQPCYVAAVEAVTEQEWPGRRLGLPQSGSGAVAGWGRRVLALFLDWLLSLLAVGAGGSAGQLILRIGVRRVNGRVLDPIRVLARTLLILLVIPPVVYNRDQRGLHDLAVDSIVVRR